MCKMCAKFLWLTNSIVMLSALLPSWVSLIWDSEKYFASLSNVAFFAVIIIIPLMKYELSYFAQSSILAYTLVGAASFAFHVQRGALYSPSHILDLAMAWMWYTYLAIFAMNTLLCLTWPRFETLIHTISYLAMAMTFAAMFLLFDYVYDHQLVLFISTGTTVYVATLFIYWWHHTKYFSLVLFDVVVLIIIQSASIVLQGNILASTFDAHLGYQSESRYNIEHGHWHFGSAMVSVILLCMISKPDSIVRSKRKAMIQCIVTAYQVALAVLFFVKVESYTMVAFSLYVFTFSAVVALCPWKALFHTRREHVVEGIHFPL